MESAIAEISPLESKEKVERKKAVLLDVRERDEWNAGHIPDAIHIPRGELEKKIEHQVPDKTTEIICQCRSGKRSLLAAQTLKQLGYTNVVSMNGGIEFWSESGFPTEKKTLLSKKEEIRYTHHLRLPEIGEEGQLKLKRAKVLIIGAGGLGSPAALYLTAAGVGTIGIVDDDAIEISNLQRQILHTTDRMGKSKVESAQQTLNALNPTIEIQIYNVRLTKENASSLIAPYDIVINASDNFETRYIINDICLQLETPQLHGSVDQWEGEVTLFLSGKGCYRCLYPEAPTESCGCNERGVLGVIPGIIGTLQALEAIKWILGKGELLTQRLLRYNGLKGSFTEIMWKQDPHCQYCREKHV